MPPVLPAGFGSAWLACLPEGMILQPGACAGWNLLRDTFYLLRHFLWQQ